MKNHIFILFSLAMVQSLMADSLGLEQKISALRDPNFEHVFVVAHRGDWRNAPENSLLAIEKAIEIGADVVEIDVRKTKDGVLILMHDETIDRTTSGHGRVDELCAAQLEKLRLRNGLGRITRFRIPTLEQALIAAKGRIIINIDKAGDYLDLVYKVLDQTDTIHQVIVKSSDSCSEISKSFGDVIHQFIFMPVIKLENANSMDVIDEYIHELNPIAFEIVFAEDEPKNWGEIVSKLDGKSRIWINSLFPEISGGHYDDRALVDIEGSYGWILSHGATIIQTDRLGLLIGYLEEQGLRNSFSKDVLINKN